MTIRRAEKLLKQGRLDAAIAEYVQAVEEQPRDWNTVNILGDLYARAGQVESAVSQYARVAAHFAQEGFLQKSAALYKKIAKFKPQDEGVLLRLADLSEQQGLVADAKSCLSSVAEHRRRRGNRKGAAEIVLRLANLDPADLSASLLAARAAAELGDTADAVARFKASGHELLRRSRTKEGLRALSEAAALDPSDKELHQFLQERHLAAGQLDQARESEPAAGGEAEQTAVADAAAADHDTAAAQDSRGLGESDRAGGGADRRRAAHSVAAGMAADDTPLGRAERALRTGRYEEGRAILDALVAAHSVLRDQLVSLGSSLIDVDPDAAFVCVDVASDAAVADDGFEAAAAGIDAFVRRVPDHVAALMKLIEVSVDGGLDSTMYAAQARLADAYLVADRPADARVIAEDLVAREPWQRANVDRLRRALVALGEAEPDRLIADYLSGASPLALTALWEEAGRQPSSPLQAPSPDEPSPAPPIAPPDDGEIELDFRVPAEPTADGDAVSAAESVFDTWLDAQERSPLLDRPFEELVRASLEPAAPEPVVELPPEPPQVEAADAGSVTTGEGAPWDAACAPGPDTASEAPPAALGLAEPAADTAVPEAAPPAAVWAEPEPVLEVAVAELAAIVSEPILAEPILLEQPEAASDPTPEPEAGPEPVSAPRLVGGELDALGMVAPAEGAGEPPTEPVVQPAEIYPEQPEPGFSPPAVAESEPEAVAGPLLAEGDLAALGMAVAAEEEQEPAPEFITEPAAGGAEPTARAPGGAFEPTATRALAINADSAIDEPAEAEETDVGGSVGPASLPAGRADDLDRVFEMFRDEAALRGLADMGAQHLKLAAAYRDIGMIDECLQALEVAAHSPRHRFEATSLLAETLRDQGRTREAVEWFERAAEAPAPGVEAGRRLLYELGKTLSDVGESARALAVFLELQADAPDYRDIAVRVRRLSSAT